jgi:hypothetical protein
MASATSDLPPTGGWTVDDLYAMPEDGVRRELLDGVLLVRPSPTDTHQIIAMRPMVALEDCCPSEFQATQGGAIRFDRRRVLAPDVLVATWLYRPHEVVLETFSDEIVAAERRATCDHIASLTAAVRTSWARATGTRTSQHKRWS